jgi:predicted  nucleic acid-binding Zn-ribbon protein
MISDRDRAMSSLHQRAVRGDTLESGERADLQAWYDEQDRLEALQLRIPPTPIYLQRLRDDLDQATQRLASATQRVQELAAQNAAIRQGIATLEQRLAQRDGSS